jgi:hypothetical protein
MLSRQLEAEMNSDIRRSEKGGNTAYLNVGAWHDAKTGHIHPSDTAAYRVVSHNCFCEPCQQAGASKPFQ